MGDELCYQQESLCLSRCDKRYCVDHTTTFCCSDYYPGWKNWMWAIVAAVVVLYVVLYLLWRTCQQRKLISYQSLEETEKLNCKMQSETVQHQVSKQEQIVVV
ncbi:Hypothetical_protein [Hexamita inflata]|uniref:Hypothetical_protein n=1 Tax=Hexamita inflata TaxID=28002 RepID=A0AA86NT73_9EUKA|nr:Hypothetical protein HINF_LOCUS13722 [Hexamita inflata]